MDAEQHGVIRGVDQLHPGLLIPDLFRVDRGTFVGIVQFLAVPGHHGGDAEQLCQALCPLRDLQIDKALQRTIRRGSAAVQSPVAPVDDQRRTGLRSVTQSRNNSLIRFVFEYTYDYRSCEQKKQDDCRRNP